VQQATSVTLQPFVLQVLIVMTENSSSFASSTDASVLYAALPGSAISVSDSEVLFIANLPESARAAGVDHRHVMTFDVHAAFVECAPFATLAEHAKHLSERFPALAPANIERVLSNLCQRGLMQSDVELRRRLALAPSGNSAPLSGVAIMSPGHPAALEAMLASAAETPPVRDRSYALMDLSHEPEHRARKVELMAEFGRRTGQRVVLLEQKRERWLADRMQQMPEHADGLNVLFGKQAGRRARALNIIAAAYAGDRALVVDDSIRFRTYGPAGGAIHLAGVAHRRAVLYPNVEIALQQNPRGPSLWQLAETVLGKNVGALVSGVELYGRALEEFDGYERARVARLGLGVLGSADTAHSFWGFTIAPEQHPMLRTRDDVQAALAGDSVLLAGTQATLAPALGTSANAMDFSGAHGFAFGDLDGAERSLAALTSFVDAGAMELNLPIALERRGAPVARASANREPLTLSVARFFADHVAQLQSLCFAAEPSARWRWLAVQCLDLAEAPKAEREQILWRYTTAKRAELLSELQRLLVAAGTQTSEPWRHELIGVIQAQAEGMMQSNHPGLDGFARELSPADALSQQLRSFAQAALAWGALWQNAREFRLA
jgi:hypothetical protein